MFSFQQFQSFRSYIEVFDPFWVDFVQVESPGSGFILLDEVTNFVSTIDEEGVFTPFVYYGIFVKKKKSESWSFVGL